MADIANILKGVSDQQLIDMASGPESFLALETAAILGLSAYNMSRIIKSVEREQKRRKAEKRLAQIVAEEGAVPIFQSGGVSSAAAAADALASVRASQGSVESEPLLGSSRRNTGLRQRRGTPSFTFDDPGAEQVRIREAITDAFQDVPLEEPAVESEPARQARPRRLPKPNRRTAGLVASAATTAIIASIIGVDASNIKINPDGTADVIDKDGNRRTIDVRKYLNTYGQSPSAVPSYSTTKLTHKYRTPRKGRYNYVDFVTHAYAAAARTGAVNSIVNKNITSKVNQMDNKARNINLIRNVKG